MEDQSNRRQKIKVRAVAVLARRERSRKGLFLKLKEDFWDEGDKELIESVLDELEQRKYLSDERFARQHVLVRSSRYGDMRLKYELSREGVDAESIQEALENSEVSEFDRAKAIWERKFGAPPEDFKERAKQIRFLASRGFSSRTIGKVLRCEVPDEDW